MFISGIFVFVLDCMLIDDMVRLNPNNDCRGSRGNLRLFILVLTIPFQLTVCGMCGDSMVHPFKGGRNFYLPQSEQEAEFQIVL